MAVGDGSVVAGRVRDLPDELRAIVEGDGDLVGDAGKGCGSSTTASGARPGRQRRVVRAAGVRNPFSPRSHVIDQSDRRAVR